MDPAICTACAEDPTCHSFTMLGERNGVSVFYTCPANASKYNDTTGILLHYDNMLHSHHPLPWIWIFDSTDFSVKHMMEMSTGIGLARLISTKYADSLQKIYVVHPTWHIRSMYNLLYPFLSDRVRNCVVIREDTEEM